MAKTIRKRLIEKADQALGAIDRLDKYLYDMDELDREGRQEAIQAAKFPIVNTQELLRDLWTRLRDCL